MKEEIIELIRAEFEHGAHPQITDDFDTVWAIHEKYNPFSDDAYVPAIKYNITAAVDLTKCTSKKELMERVSELPDDAVMQIDADDDSVMLYASTPYTETKERTAYKLYCFLMSWASLQHYRLCKKSYMLEKQNAELMEQINSGLSKLDNEQFIKECIKRKIYISKKE